MTVIKIDQNRIRKYRVWFKAYTFSLAGFAPGGAPGNEVHIEGMTAEGVPMDAYTAKDAIDQAHLEIYYHHSIFSNPLGPLQIVICKVRPEAEPPPDVCPHLPPCVGQCEGFPIESDSHG
jgi:hypothetical protein